MLVSPSDISTGEYFTVHDMFHELAKTIAGSDCVKIEKSITRNIFLNTFDIFASSHTVKYCSQRRFWSLKT